MPNPNLFTIAVVSVIVILSSSSFIFAHPHSGQIFTSEHIHQPQTEYIPINEIIGIEKTLLTFNAPEENSLPWGFVEGKIANPVEGYPVIIQIFKNYEAFHFAQTDVDENGNYEYKFRVLNVEEDKTTKIFEGEYQVTIFKAVYFDQSNSI